MRTLCGSIISLIAITTPAVANQCYWVGHQIYCDAGCWVTDRWFDGSRDWMRYSCGPPPELVLAVIVVIIAVIVVAIIGGFNSGASTNAHQADIEQIERDIAADNELKQEMQAAIRKADVHIAAMLAKHREGDRHG